MRLIFIGMIVLASCTLSLAQGDLKKPAENHPNLSGTWTLDRSKTDDGAYEDTAKDNKFTIPDLTWLITHHDAQIDVSWRESAPGSERLIRKGESVYFTDGRGEKNAITASQSLESTTTWSGRKLVRLYSVPTRSITEFGYRYGKVAVTEKWEHSKDSKKLTITRSYDGAAGLLSAGMGRQLMFTGMPNSFGFKLALIRQ